MKTILVPTDFSDTASNAANYAAGLAKELHARVLLLHTYHLPMFAKEKVGVITDPDLYDRKYEELLKNEAKRLNETYGIDVKYRLKIGFLVDEIIEAEKDASLVVMGLYGAGYQGKIFPGSMVTATVAKSKKPVMIVPEKATFIKPSKIVFACDYDSNTDVNALNALKEMVKTFEPVVYVVNVRHEEEVILVDHEVSEKIENKLANVHHVYSFPRSENMPEKLNEFISDHDVNLLVMIPHRYNLLDSLFHQSFTKKMSFHTYVPMLALPEHFSSLPGYLL